MVLVFTALPHKCQTPYVKIIDLNLGTNLIRRAGRHLAQTAWNNQLSSRERVATGSECHGARIDSTTA